MYVLKINGEIMGYVTLVNAHIRHDATESIDSKELDGTIPVLLVSYLAVHKDHQRRHVRKTILKEIFALVVPKITYFSGCRYMMLNPRADQVVRDFYTYFGFDYYEKFIEGRVKDRETDKVMIKPMMLSCLIC